MNDQSSEGGRVDENGIPILDEVVAESEAERARMESHSGGGLDLEIHRLARSIAAEVAVKYARELETRVLHELTPLLEARMRTLREEGAGAGEEKEQEQE